MRHLKKYESKFPSPNDPSLYEPEVYKLYEEYKSLLKKNTDITEEEIRDRFLEVQNEMDEMDGELPLKYGVFFVEKTPFTKYTYFGIYYAKGEMHALIRCSIDMEYPELIFDKNMRAEPYDDDYIESKVDQLEDELKIWKNVK